MTGTNTKLTAAVEAYFAYLGPVRTQWAVPESECNLDLT